MKVLLSLLILVGILGWSVGCIDEDELRGSSESPIIIAITPDSGYPGDTISLQGDRFQNIETDSVFINGVYSYTIAHTSEEINFVVGDSASSGPVAVRTPLGFTIGPEFIVLNDSTQLIVESISPALGPELTVVTITGRNFGSNLSNIEVTVNDEPCQVNSVSDTEIEFIVPVGATTGPVKVSNTATLQEDIGPVFTVEISDPVITVSTVAGLSQNDNVGNPWQIVPDGAGNFYFTDPGNHQIKRITSDGIVSVYAGTGEQGFTNGNTSAATFNSPAGLAIDGQGNLYVADAGNHAIRLISTNQLVSTLAGIGQPGFADGLAQQQAQFNIPVDVAIDGNLLFISDFNNHAIRQLDIQGDMVTTVAGNGTTGFVDGDSQAARFNAPIGLALDLNNNLLIADALNNSIRLLDRDANSVSTITGNSSSGFADGDVAQARFRLPYDVGIDNAGVIYIPDRLNHSIRKVENAFTTTLAGTGVAGFNDGPGGQAQFNDPYGLAVVSSSEIWVCDFTNGLIRKITIE